MQLFSRQKCSLDCKYLALSIFAVNLPFLIRVNRIQSLLCDIPSKIFRAASTCFLRMVKTSFSVFSMQKNWRFLLVLIIAKQRNVLKNQRRISIILKSYIGAYASAKISNRLENPADWLQSHCLCVFWWLQLCQTIILYM